MNKLLFLIAFCVCFSCKDTSKTETTSSLLKTFNYSANDTPIISVHRGGKAIPGYPENCLETLQYVNSKIPAIFEVDVAKTKDNVLVLMHDDNLERTTTGQGKLNSHTFIELSSLNLVDDYGSATVFKIPKFRDVLVWAKENKIVLTIDIKRSVNVKDVVDLIREVKAENVSILITYDMKQAERAYKLAPDLLLSVTVRNQKELDWLLHSNIPTENMLAFTGTRQSSPELYDKIHSYGIKCILGTLGNLDNQAKSKGDYLYKEWVSNGIDVIATDRPFAVASALQLKN